MPHPTPIPQRLSFHEVIRRIKQIRINLTAQDLSDNSSLLTRLADVFLRTWDLGLTAFGGPPVHFQILHQRFISSTTPLPAHAWADEQTYQELFALSQALPGPASTKLLFCLTLSHAGLLPALLAFFFWAAPGALGMYGLSLGVQRIGDSGLPAAVYALLSGLNASTVGIIALAAVQLAERAIADRLSRGLVVAGGCAGLCYNALWYFPLLMGIGGAVVVVWDGWMEGWVRRVKLWRRRRRDGDERVVEAGDTGEEILVDHAANQAQLQRRAGTSRSVQSDQSGEGGPSAERTSHPQQLNVDTNGTNDRVRVSSGVVILLLFFASFITVLVIRSTLNKPPLIFKLFANMYLAGTIIFGGGPVVIPLLREYVVNPGWVSSRDFLLGLAIIQAFPGPNFNFAVYLGALVLARTDHHTLLGALLAFTGIFLPGLALAVAVQSFWKILRTRKWVLNLLRGLNATAVGLVFTAVYRLWEIGYLTPNKESGQSLANEPWWVVVAAVTYAESAWYGVPPPIAIAGGAVLGLCWYGAVGK